MKFIAEKVIDGMIAAKDLEDRQVRVYRDLNGDVSVATMDDICIDAADDPRVALITSLANNYEWDESSDFPSNFESYEGGLNALVSSVLNQVLRKE